MKDGPPLAIDHMILYQMMADPAFFTQVPLFYFLKDQAAAIVARIVAQVVDRRGGCSGCGNVRLQMRPLTDAFTRVVVPLAKENPAALEPLASYISQRRGFRPRPLRVYHRTDGRLEAVEF